MLLISVEFTAVEKKCNSHFVHWGSLLPKEKHKNNLGNEIGQACNFINLPF